MSYIDEHIEYLGVHEGTEGGSERQEDSSKSAAPYGLDNPPIDRKDKESDKAFAKRVLQHFEKKAQDTFKDAYNNAPIGVKRAVLDSYYNSGKLYDGQIASLKGSDYPGFAKNTLDIVSAKDDAKNGISAVSKGLANRKAATYNLMAADAGLPLITGGEFLEVDGKARIIYNTTGEPYTFDFNKPRHTKSDPGALKVKTVQPQEVVEQRPTGFQQIEQQMFNPFGFNKGENVMNKMNQQEQRPMINSQAMPQPQSQAQGLASLGRGGDSTLVHMQPQEVAGLQQMAQANGTSLTTNPMTGMPEAFNLGGVFRAALPIAAGYFMGPAGMQMGMGAGIAAGAATGAGIAAVSGEDVLAGGLSGGLGGYSGFGASGAFSGVGDAFSGVEAAGNAVPYAPGSVMPAASTATTSGMTAGMGGDIAGASSLGGGNALGQGGASMMPPSSNVSVPTSNGGFGAAKDKLFDNIDRMTQTEEMIPVNSQNKGGFDKMINGVPMQKTGNMVEGSFFDKAKVLGAPAVSMGLGGLEVSDFYDDDIEFSDPRDKYDPYSRLNLNTDTGIKGALASDSGLRLYAEGGPINLNTKTQAPSGRGLNLNTRTQGPSGRGLNLNTGMTGVSPADLAAAALRKTKFKTMPNGQEVPIDFDPGGFQGVMGGMQNAPQSHYKDSSGNWQKGQKPGTFQIGGNNGIGNQFSSITGTNYYAQGGAVKGYAEGGYLKGPGDGMSDDIPATINGEQPAALADGEFVVPADVVSHLGNGSSEAGSKQLYAMMDRIRKARTGRESQGKEIKPKKYMPR